MSAPATQVRRECLVRDCREDIPTGALSCPWCGTDQHALAAAQLATGDRPWIHLTRSTGGTPVIEHHDVALALLAGAFGGCTATYAWCARAAHTDVPADGRVYIARHDGLQDPAPPGWHPAPPAADSGIDALVDEAVEEFLDALARADLDPSRPVLEVAAR